MTEEVLKAALELVERYNTITLEEIDEAKCNKERLTGYGAQLTCTLCIASSLDDGTTDCNRCIYALTDDNRSYIECLKGEHNKTYYDIQYSTNAQELQTAYRNRADHITTILREKGILI